MEKRIVMLPKVEVRRLRQIAAKRRIPLSAVVREAVQTWLKIQGDKDCGRPRR